LICSSVHKTKNFIFWEEQKFCDASSCSGGFGFEFPLVDGSSSWCAWFLWFHPTNTVMVPYN